MARPPCSIPACHRHADVLLAHRPVCARHALALLFEIYLPEPEPNVTVYLDARPNEPTTARILEQHLEQHRNRP